MVSHKGFGMLYSGTRSSNYQCGRRGREGRRKGEGGEEGRKDRRKGGQVREGMESLETRRWGQIRDPWKEAGNCDVCSSLISTSCSHLPNTSTHIHPFHKIPAKQ